MPPVQQIAEYQESLLDNIIGLEGAINVGEASDQTHWAGDHGLYRGQVAQVEGVAGMSGVGVVACFSSEGESIIRGDLKGRFAVTQFSF